MFVSILVEAILMQIPLNLFGVTYSYLADPSKWLQTPAVDNVEVFDDDSVEKETEGWLPIESLAGIAGELIPMFCLTSIFSKLYAHFSFK